MAHSPVISDVVTCMTSLAKDPKSELTTLVLGTERGFVYILDFDGNEITHQGFMCKSVPVQIATQGSLKTEA